MDDSMRKQRLRQRRREAGWKAYEVWLDATARDLVEKLRQPGESVDAVLQRALRGLQAETSLVPRAETSLVSRAEPSHVPSPVPLDPSPALDALIERLADGVAARLTERLALQPPAAPAAAREPTRDLEAARRQIIPKLQAMRAKKGPDGKPPSYRAIAEQLTAEGVPALRGERWHKSVVHDLLRKYGARYA
jgi:hypothetical protein